MLSQVLLFYIVTVAVNFIVVIITCISIIVIFIIILTSFFYPYFNVIIGVSILPIFIIKVESCTLNNLVPCSIGIESHMTFKAKFVQRN